MAEKQDLFQYIDEIKKGMQEVHDRDTIIVIEKLLHGLDVYKFNKSRDITRIPLIKEKIERLLSNEQFYEVFAEFNHDIIVLLDMIDNLMLHDYEQTRLLKNGIVDLLGIIKVGRSENKIEIEKPIPQAEVQIQEENPFKGIV